MARIVQFKHEEEVDGMPIGPMVIFDESEDDEDDGEGPEALLFGPPYVPPCLCEKPKGSPGEKCEECDREIRQAWVTLAEAEAKAAELGLELRET
jgi:hypothetical protein